jgi:hypothetical protein
MTRTGTADRRCGAIEARSRASRSFQELENSVKSRGRLAAPGGNAASRARASWYTYSPTPLRSRSAGR